MDWIVSQLAEVVFEKVACVIILKCLHSMPPAVRRVARNFLRRPPE